MIRLGRHERLRKFIVNAMLERRSDQLSKVSYVELAHAAPAGASHTRLDQSSGDQLAGRDVLLGSAGPRR
jgi:hypothetical protein